MESETPTFFYTEFTAQNLGFVTSDEQEQLRTSHAFVCGIGGRGGAALQSLVRMGIENFTIADDSVVEVSNLNHQVFAAMDAVGTEKTDATTAAILSINPHANVKAYGGNWSQSLPRILADADIIINGRNDVSETVKLYRACRDSGHTIVDAYTAPVPSVFVTRAGEPTPEERLKFPTVGKPSEEWTPDDISTAVLRELEYVMMCSSSRQHISVQTHIDVARGKRSRMSFAPVEIISGNLMAYEAYNSLLKKQPGATDGGYFFNPYTCRTERPPKRWMQWWRLRSVRREIAALSSEV